MDRLAIIMAFCALFLTVSLTAQPAPGSCACGAPNPYVCTSLAAQPPLVGIATIIAPCGQFYLNVGAKEDVRLGAELTITRAGCILGRACVVKVDVLDSIAQLYPESQHLRVIPGDVVLVNNADARQWCGRYCPYRLRNDDCMQLTNRLPWIEPNIDPGFYDSYEFYTVVLLGLTIANSVH